MRTVFMKLWGVAGARRKYASTVSSEDRNGQANGNARPTSSSSGFGTRTSPPPAFQVLEEEDRLGNNRTPCPHSYTQSSPLASPRSPTKSHGRFFSGLTSGLVADDAPALQEQPSLDARMMTCSQSKKRKRDSLRVIVPESNKQTGLTTSPRKARMRAFGRSFSQAPDLRSASQLARCRKGARSFWWRNSMRNWLQCLGRLHGVTPQNILRPDYVFIAFLRFTDRRSQPLFPFPLPLRHLLIALIR